MCIPRAFKYDDVAFEKDFPQRNRSVKTEKINLIGKSVLITRWKKLGWVSAALGIARKLSYGMCDYEQ